MCKIIHNKDDKAYFFQFITSIKQFPKYYYFTPISKKTSYRRAYIDKINYLIESDINNQDFILSFN